MSIKVKYFGSLKQWVGRSEDEINFTVSISVKEAWMQVNGQKPMPVNTLSSVNFDYVEPDYKLNDGDELAFFPPVTGG
ncbi:MAG: MoaD/ThiS family protein [Methylicorpusculum sp.]|uniref:MoaD/ThiS family protein n=1 Tax=Methylicorpusculum sp. TaxID=2713644 RepID=UPI0027190B12|nr:MoaD/ThiS family protein [Methylicorpusculum sp.]MDO8846508.1 MoaD/ThiS family protein [Methylicorpusculum sp.]MDO8939946.1 MoaD/ThiS family protein [Methylicorpusculum sp.]MDP2180521.1 MoaD/ThiS family protein [Methylicorpusculum sp.]MDP2201332.1 MoaD/ThiS family protein [Methylicorpusculum sp.]MDP3529231.1 MoaD/ThiS family protein [Methylicorpusculum sp.]